MASINYGPLIKESNRKGQIDLSAFIPVLDLYQSEGIDYLYDLEPQSNNLFWAGYFYEGMDDTGKYAIKPFYNAAYRIRQITIPVPTLQHEVHKELRIPIFKEVNNPQEVTINWYEDVYHSVKKYHLDWQARWYNKSLDVLRCGVKGKFRQLTVVAFHYVNKNTDTLIETPEIQPLFAIKIGGLVPQDFPQFTFGHNEPANEKAFDVKYKCGQIQWTYSDEIGLGGGADSTINKTEGIAAGLEGAERTQKSWWPNNYTEESVQSVPGASVPSEGGLEKLRVIRQSTSYQLAEGNL